MIVKFLTFYRLKGDEYTTIYTMKMQAIKRPLEASDSDKDRDDEKKCYQQRAQIQTTFT